jgi:peroxiredoxin
VIQVLKNKNQSMKNIATSILCLCSVVLFAQQAEDFTLVNAVDGKSVSLKNYQSNPGVVIIFMMNDCPFDDYYSDRINDLGSGKLPLLLINSHPDQNVSLESMSKCASKRTLNAPYLADVDQKVMQNLGAHKSTEVFLLKNNSGKFSVFYHGAIDDNPQVAADVKHAYLKEAINALLSGQSYIDTGVRPVGCNIRKK